MSEILTSAAHSSPSSVACVCFLAAFSVPSRVLAAADVLVNVLEVLAPHSNLKQTYLHMSHNMRKFTS